MQKRALGNSGLEISPIVFGASVFGWTVDEASAFTLLDAFVDAGFDCVDTADLYSFWAPGNVGGESETIIGNWFATSGKRARVTLATKCGSPRTPGGGGLHAKHILDSIDRQLTRLKTDYIDLYQAHRDDLITPPDEMLGAYEKLISSGKVRAIGASNFLAPRLRQSLDYAAAHGLPQFRTLQPNYNLYDRFEYEGALSTLCVERGIGVIPYFSLASGFLTGKYRSEADLGTNSARGGDVEKYLNPRGFRILAALDRAAEKTGATHAQLALAWMLTRPAVVAPITSATRLSQLTNILQAAELTLDLETLADLEEASASRSMS